MRTRDWAPCALLILICATGSAGADTAKSTYPAMAPVAQYLGTGSVDEVALARSAAPTSISGDADVLTLGKQGYEAAAKGKNGFVCLVERSWGAGFGDPVFWNPKIRGPICFNPAGVRSVLPGYLERTKWVLAGVSKSDMTARTRAAVAANTYIMPEPGVVAYMLSKQQYVSDTDGHWHPHLMFWIAHSDSAAWGANRDGSPIYAEQGDPEPVTTFIIPVTHWSDGTASVMEKH